MNHKSKKGAFRVDVFAMCGICQNLEFVDTAHSTATIAARSMGYRRTKKHGWVCPECINGMPVASAGSKPS